MSLFGHRTGIDDDNRMGDGSGITDRAKTALIVRSDNAPGRPGPGLPGQQADTDKQLSVVLRQKE